LVKKILEGVGAVKRSLEGVLRSLETLLEKVDFTPIRWENGKVVWLDVSLLPWEEVYREAKDAARLAEAIKKLEIRGAPAIGVAAALGVAAEVYNREGSVEDLKDAGRKAIEILRRTRPTAYNLFYALERVGRVIESYSGSSPSELKEAVLAEALSIMAEDLEANIRMGELGSELISDGETILTHCNTGSLATSGLGTALGVIKTAWRKGKEIKVIATETRPLLQGARLTAWELKKAGIPFKLISDGAVGYLFSEELVDRVLVGADRITIDGYVANKIGTYTIAVVAWRHGKPFHVVAPTSTIHAVRYSEKKIEIEHRSPTEVTRIMGKLQIAPEGTEALNPAFDVTPPDLITSIITERGVAWPPFAESLEKLLGSKTL